MSAPEGPELRERIEALREPERGFYSHGYNTALNDVLGLPELRAALAGERTPEPRPPADLFGWADTELLALNTLVQDEIMERAGLAPEPDVGVNVGVNVGDPPTAASPQPEPGFCGAVSRYFPEKGSCDCEKGHTGLHQNVASEFTWNDPIAPVVPLSVSEAAKTIRDKMRSGTFGVVSELPALIPTLEWLGAIIARVPQGEVERMKGCDICGGRMVEARPRYPGSEPRIVCPTCLADRLANVFEIANPQTYRALAASGTPEPEVGDGE